MVLEVTYYKTRGSEGCTLESIERELTESRKRGGTEEEMLGRLPLIKVGGKVKIYGAGHKIWDILDFDFVKMDKCFGLAGREELEKMLEAARNAAESHDDWEAEKYKVQASLIRRLMRFLKDGEKIFIDLNY